MRCSLIGPPRLHAVLTIGHLVWVPLRQRRVQGVVLDLYAQGDNLHHADNDLSPSLLRPERSNAQMPTLRDLIDIADPDVALTPAQIRLARWIAGYYRVSLYEALSLMLPPGATREAETTWRATVEGRNAALGALPPGERDVLYLLRRSGEMTERDLRRRLRGSDAELQAIYAALRERGLIERGMILSRARAPAPNAWCALRLRQTKRAPG